MDETFLLVEVGVLVMLGGGRFIQPIIESYALLSIEPMQIDLLLEDAVGNISGTEEEGRRLNVSVTGVAKISEKIRSAAEGDLKLMGIAVPSLFLRIRDTKPMPRGIEVVEQVSRELHRLDLRIRRIEEKLGLSTP